MNKTEYAHYVGLISEAAQMVFDEKMKDAGDNPPDDFMILSAFLSSTVGVLVSKTMKYNLIGVTAGVAYEKNGATRISGGALPHQTREQNMALTVGLYNHWRIVPWQGELGAEGELAPDHYAIAGEDIQAGDPMEIIGGRFYVHHNLKEAKNEN